MFCHRREHITWAAPHHFSHILLVRSGHGSHWLLGDRILQGCDVLGGHLGCVCTWGERDLVLFREHLPSTQDAPGTVSDPSQEGHFPCPLLGGLQPTAGDRPEVWSQWRETEVSYFVSLLMETLWRAKIFKLKWGRRGGDQRRTQVGEETAQQLSFNYSGCIHDCLPD